MIDPILVANDPAPLSGALLCGEGLMLVSDVTIKAYAEQGFVQRVLGGWTGPDYEFNAVFPRGRVQSPKVRAFVDFLVERLNFDADYMHVLCEESKRCQQLATRPSPSKARSRSRAGASKCTSSSTTGRRVNARPVDEFYKTGTLPMLFFGSSQNDSRANRLKISSGRMGVRSIGSTFGRTVCRPGMPTRSSNSFALYSNLRNHVRTRVRR